MENLASIVSGISSVYQESLEKEQQLVAQYNSLLEKVQKLELAEETRAETGSSSSSTIAGIRKWSREVDLAEEEGRTHVS